MQCPGFLDSLAAADDDTWQELAAGYLAIRSAKNVIDISAGRAQQVAYARSRAMRLTRLPVRTRLLSVLKHLEQIIEMSDEHERMALGRELLAYGNDLHRSGHLSAAADVFAALAASLASDQATRLEALQAQAYTFRTMRSWEGAYTSYAMMRDLASRLGDYRMELEADLGPAYIEVERGDDLLGADDIASKVYRRARSARIPEVIGKALMTRAVIAGITKNPADTIIHSHAALEYLPPIERERNLLNIAIAFREINRPEPSTSITDYLLERAQDVYIRLMAGLHRYHLAIDEGDEVTLAQLAPRLVDAQKLPHAEFSYYEALARGHASAGRFLAAEKDGIKAAGVARTHGMNENLARAEAALTDIRAGIVPSVYGFRPATTTTAAKRKLAAVERDLKRLCAA